MDFKKRIEEKGLKRKWVALKVGVSQTLLSFYLTDTRPMPDSVKSKLEELLK